MKKIVKVLALLLVVALVATVFVGAGAADLKNAKSNLSISGTLVPEDLVTATVSFTTNVKDLSVGDTLSVSTPFDSWEAVVDVKGDSQSYTEKLTSKRSTMDCVNFLSAGNTATVTVTCTGYIPNNTSGDIVPLAVTLKSTASPSESGTATTETVNVYNMRNLEKDKAAVSEGVSKLTQRLLMYNIPEVTALGINFGLTEKYLSDAENYMSQAQTTTVNDNKAAHYIIEANNKIALAEEAINETTLQIARAKLDQVNSLIGDLKGLNYDVDNLSTKYTVYEGTLAGYNKTTDSAKVDELIANIDELYKEATEKMNPSSVAPEFPEWLPWVIIAGIGAIVLAIVIILVVRRHKKNSWDELG